MLVVALSYIQRLSRVSFDGRAAELSVNETMSQLILLDALCSEKNASLHLKDRRLVIEHGGLHPLQRLCLHDSQAL